MEQQIGKQIKLISTLKMNIRVRKYLLIIWFGKARSFVFVKIQGIKLNRQFLIATVNFHQLIRFI